MHASARGLNQGAVGMQQYLLITEVPDGAEQSLVGKRLISAGPLVVAGDYYCRFYLGGVLAAECHLTATFGGGETLSSHVYTTYKNGEADPCSDATAKDDFTSDGAMTTATAQHSTIDATDGSQYGMAKLTITGTGGVTFTVGEVNGQ